MIFIKTHNQNLSLALAFMNTMLPYILVAQRLLAKPLGEAKSKRNQRRWDYYGSLQIWGIITDHYRSEAYGSLQIWGDRDRTPL